MMPQFITVIPLTSVRASEIVDDGPLVLNEIQVKTLPFPIGIPIPWPSITVPSWGIALEGQSVLRTLYPVMFTIYGVTYGSVDGTHFTLPNYTGFTLVGYKAADTDFNAITKTGGEKTHLNTGPESGLPAHGHTLPYLKANTGGNSAIGGLENSAYYAATYLTTDAAGPLAATVAHNNLQPFKVVRWIARSG